MSREDLKRNNSDYRERDKIKFFVNDDEIIKACIQIIVIVFATLGLVFNARTSLNISEVKFKAIIESLLIILLLFSVPIIVFLAMDLFQSSISIYRRKEELERLRRLIRLYFFFSLFTIPLSFVVISDSLDVNILQGESSPIFVTILLLVLIFLLIITVIFLRTALESTYDFLYIIIERIFRIRGSWREFKDYETRMIKSDRFIAITYFVAIIIVFFILVFYFPSLVSSLVSSLLFIPIIVIIVLYLFKTIG